MAGIPLNVKVSSDLPFRSKTLSPVDLGNIFVNSFQFM